MNANSEPISLMGLVGEVGDLHSMMKKLILPKSHPSLPGRTL